MEERIVDPVTGGEKCSKLARFDLIPTTPLWELAEHYGKGCKKYSDNNWRKGYRWGLSFAALMRHLTQFWSGEDYDTETGSKHIIAAAWHCFALAEFMDVHQSFDDRQNDEKLKEQSVGKTIYIAGPMRGLYLYNFPEFDAWGDKLIAKGWDIISPAQMDRDAGFDPCFLPDTHDWNNEPPGMNIDIVMGRDLAAIEQCDAIALMPRWWGSEGAMREKEHADKYNIKLMLLANGVLSPEELFNQE